MNKLIVGDSVTFRDNGNLAYGIIRAIDGDFLSISDIRVQRGEKYADAGYDACLLRSAVRPLSQLGVWE